MTPESLLLIALLVWQQWFWMRHTQKLVDKLMSRNYGEYQVAAKPKETPPKEMRVPLPPLEDLGSLKGIGV